MHSNMDWPALSKCLGMVLGLAYYYPQGCHPCKHGLSLGMRGASNCYIFSEYWKSVWSMNTSNGMSHNNNSKGQPCSKTNKECMKI